MDHHRNRDGVEGRSRPESGVYRAIAPQLLTKLRQERSAAAGRVELFRALIKERHDSSGDQDVSWLALQEIDTAHEELRVAEEHVHELADEMLAARADVEAERRIYRELFDLAPEAYLVTSDKGTILQANHAAGELFDRNAAFLLGKPLATLIASEHRSTFLDLLSTMGSHVLRTELRARTGPGDRSCAVSVSARRGLSGGESSCIRWIFASLSDDEDRESRREQRERELHERVHELEASQRALGHLLEREQKASQDAEERNRLKGQALAAVAHEIRGPLGTIAGWLHMLDKTGMAAEVRKRAALSMARSVRALARLVDDLVEHARVENYKVVLNASPLNLVRLVAETTEDVRPLAEIKKIRLELSAHPHSIVTHGDAWRLQQVFRNLLGNALKFTSEHGVVRVSSTTVGDRAEVSISDTGRGIERGDLKKIFTPFAQLREPSTGNDGLGLGLSIAHGLVELHGGTLEARSDGPGRGSTFVVRLPLAPEGTG
jgi:PAS domain S-box-containing protein